MKKILIALLILPFTIQAQSWVTVGSAGFTSDSIIYTSIAIDNNDTPYIAFDYAPLYSAMAMKFNGSSWVADCGALSVSSTNPSIAINESGNIYIVYADGDAGFNNASVRGGYSCGIIGNPDFSTGQVYSTSIAVFGGTPYVAYYDAGGSGETTVKTYHGINWVTVGSASVPGAVGYKSISINNLGTPYLVSNEIGATVWKYDGSSWVWVGNPNFSASDAGSTSIAIDGSGTPYVVYEDGGNGNKATVMKYNGSSWVNVGSAGFSAGVAQYISLAIDGTGTPYVVYMDAANSDRATVMKFITPPSSISGLTSVCTGATISLSDSTVGGTWSSSNTAVGTIGSSTGVLNGISAGTVTISYVTSGGTSTSIITVNPLPNAGIITGSLSVCVDYNITLNDITSGGTWSSSNTSIASVSSSGVITGVTSGSVTISYSVTNSCGTATATQVLTINPCTTGIKNIGNQSASFITISPNPNKGLFTVNISTPDNEEAQIIITNILGEKVKELRIPTNKKTDVQFQSPAGIYFISAVTKNKSATEKIIIE